MPNPNEDLWPDDLGKTKTVPPLAILRKQASAIREKTRFVLSADVETKSAIGSKRLYHTLYLTAPALDNYRYEVVGIRHEEGLYPLWLTSGDAGIWDKEIKNEAELVETLKMVFSAEKTRKVVEALIVQSQSN